MSVKIVTHYRCHPGSNNGKIVATALGRQRTLRIDPAERDMHAVTAHALAASLAEIGVGTGKVREDTMAGSDDGQRRVFEIVED